MALVFTAASVLVGCSNNDDVSESGEANVSMTDAAVDYKNVNAVYLSVSEVQATANGQSRTIARFDSPKQFNLMAYQNGQTYAMGKGDLKVGSYSDLRFVMSGEADSYIEMKDGSKKDLVIENATSAGYKVSGAFNVAANATTDLVADVDLRKALVTTTDGAFKLRTTGRLVNSANTGMIKGNVSGSSEERLVVYAYKKGTYTASEEAEPAQGRTRFENSVNSAIVANDGSYTLAFMEEGEYEFVVAAFENTDNDEDLEFKSSLNAEVSIAGSVFDVIELESNSTLTANILIQNQ